MISFKTVLETIDIFIFNYFSQYFISIKIRINFIRIYLIIRKVEDK